MGSIFRRDICSQNRSRTLRCEAVRDVSKSGGILRGAAEGNACGIPRGAADGKVYKGKGNSYG